MQLQFEPIGLDRQKAYLERLSLCPQKASDYSFVNLWSWADEHGLLWAWTDQLVFIKQTRPLDAYWAPVGPWKDLKWKDFVEEYFSCPAVFIRLPQMLLDIWKDNIGAGMIVDEARGHWDYLYDIREISTLKGRQFHKKKNLLNQFLKNYSYKFSPLQDDMIGIVFNMQQSWCVWRDCQSVDSLSSENGAIQRVLHQWNNLMRLKGGVILVADKIAAYSIGERLDDNTFLIHFEKGDPDYKGVYQAINKMFLEFVLSDPSCQHITVVNREQDLDDEGLREAKLSYHPVGFLKKYQVRIQSLRKWL